MKKRRKEKGGASVYLLAGYLSEIILVVWIFEFHMQALRHIHNEFDTGLLAALLSSATINVEEYGSTGNRVIHETALVGENAWGTEENASPDDECLEAALLEFQSSLQSNLSLGTDGSSAKKAVLSPVSIEEFKVFNVYEHESTGDKQIYEFTWQNGIWSVLVHEVNETVYVAGAGDRGTGMAEVTDTTLYAKIGFQISVFPYYPQEERIAESDRQAKVYMKRCVSIPENQ